MNVSITGRQVVMSEALRTVVSRKLAQLERVLNDNAVSGQCVISRERQAFVCELTVHARGDHMLVGVGRAAKLPAAVASATAKVEQQARRLTGRWKDKRRRPKTTARLAAEALAPSPERPTARVIRSRRYPVKPMSVDDAVLTLANGRESFLVFRQATTETLAVVYRRPDGNYGLIEPEA